MCMHVRVGGCGCVVEVVVLMPHRALTSSAGNLETLSQHSCPVMTMARHSGPQMLTRPALLSFCQFPYRIDE